MNNPKISVIIPVYNVEQYLRECLDSVVNQTFRDLEIICVNDGSTDGSPAILEEYSSKDNRIVVINQENSGQSVARNNGLKIATGEYVVFLDSDDYMELNLCELAYQKAQLSGADITMYFFDTFGENYMNVSAIDTIPEDEIVIRDRKIDAVNDNNNVIWNMLYKRSFLQTNNIFFLENVIFEDVHFSVKCACLCNKISVLRKRLVHYRIGCGYSTDKKQSEKQIQRIIMYNHLIDDLRKIDSSSDFLVKLYQKKWGSLYSTYYYGIPRCLRKIMLKSIDDNMTEEEYSLLQNKNVKLNSGVRNFYLSLYGSFFNRLRFKCKYIKGIIANWFAKRLFPHSPWLQEFGEREEDYKEKYIHICELMHKSQNNKPR